MANMNDSSSPVETMELDEGVQDMASISINVPTINAETPGENRMSDGISIVDMVLVYEMPDPSTIKDSNREEEGNRVKKREFYIEGLKKAGLIVEIDSLGGSQNKDTNENNDPKTFFVKLHAPWDVVSHMAEKMFLRVPIQESDIDLKTTMESLFGHQCVEGLRKSNPMEVDREVIPKDKLYFTAYFSKKHENHFLGIENKETFFNRTDRIRMVERIMSQTPFSQDDETDIGVSKLLYQSVFTAAFPLHDGPCEVPKGQVPTNSRQKLRMEWAKFGNWCTYQPLDAIKDYFGTSIGLYFAWLGFYCTMLVPVALLGCIVFLYGIIDSVHYKPAEELCDNPIDNDTYPMCPLCDKQCWYWYLKESSCTYLRVAHWFDNYLSVAFAVIMSIWSTLFLEFWKRKQATLSYLWHTSDFEEVEQQVRPEYAAVVTTLRENPATKRMEPYTPKMTIYKKYAGVFSIIILMLTLVIFAVVGVVVYRAAVFAAAASSDDDNVRKRAKVITSMTAALINLIAINILKFLYQYVAHWLTNWENPRTQTDWEDSFTNKMYLYQFVNMYSSLFYIAFFKINLFVGTPGHYVRFLNKKDGFRLDGCGAQGCLIELCIQLVIIMVGQQIIGNFTEIMIPYLTKLWNARKKKKESLRNLPQWEQDNFLCKTEGTMFWEYLEVGMNYLPYNKNSVNFTSLLGYLGNRGYFMFVLQLGFVMMFVAAFPLAPLFALVNGIIEIRVDAINFIRDQRRPSPRMAEDIGAWYRILEVLSHFSVLVNAFVIAFTSDFIPKAVYEISYNKHSDSLKGYLDNSLSYYNTSKWHDFARPRPREIFKKENITEKPWCRYIGYRESSNDEPYTKQHWEVMAARFIFIFLFLFIVFVLKWLISWIIPDIPKNLTLKKTREEHVTNTMFETDPEQGNGSNKNTYL